MPEGCIGSLEQQQFCILLNECTGADFQLSIVDTLAEGAEEPLSLFKLSQLKSFTTIGTELHCTEYPLTRQVLCNRHQFHHGAAASPPLSS